MKRSKPAIIRDEMGSAYRCEHRSCRRAARHVHHITPRCEGGTDDPDNLMLLCVEHHTLHHSTRGDYRKWGSKGGQVTQAVHETWRHNLKQYRAGIADR